MRGLSFLLLGLLVAGSAAAAINPAEFQKSAPERVRLHEVARVVDERLVEGHRWRRVTLVGTLVETHAEPPGERHGELFVIDYTVDLDARALAQQEFERTHGEMTGPQFLHDPDLPTLDADGNFWAHLAPAVGRPPRYAGAVAPVAAQAAQGPVYVPIAAQYSFERPYD